MLRRTGVRLSGKQFACTAAMAMIPAYFGTIQSSLAADPVVPPIARVEMGEKTHVSILRQGVLASLDIRQLAQCHIPMVWSQADAGLPSTCKVAYLTLRNPGDPHSHPASFPLTPYGSEDDGMGQLEMSFRRLDASSAFPQVMVSVYTGGAHCCTLTSIFDHRLDGSWQHLELGSVDGDGEPEVVDITGNGQQEILTTDQSFLYTFASHAGSNTPVIIGRYHDGELENVTRDPAYRKYLKTDLAAQRRNWIRSGRFEPNGFLAYEVATMANIGQFAKGWQDMLAHAQPSAEAGFGLSACDLKPASETDNGRKCSKKEKELLPLPKALASFLVRQGYITPEQAASVDPDATRPPASAPSQTPPQPSSQTPSQSGETNDAPASSFAASPAQQTEQDHPPGGFFGYSRGVLLLLAAAGLALYLTPAIIAYRRNTTGQKTVMAVTILLGWTGIGWIAALIMALSQPARRR